MADPCRLPVEIPTVGSAQAEEPNLLARGMKAPPTSSNQSFGNKRSQHNVFRTARNCRRTSLRKESLHVTQHPLLFESYRGIAKHAPLFMANGKHGMEHSL